jgi:hypothetical protein
MFTIRYNGMYINGRTNKPECYVTDDYGTFKGQMFKSLHAAKCAITKARKAGVPESR